jgi:predicted Ser/Thr protein kinase
MAGANASLLALSDHERHELEWSLVQFDHSWAGDQLAAWVQKLPAAHSPQRLAALVEMVKIDLERQWQQGRQVPLETYLETYPELGTVETVSPDLVQAEYEVRRQFRAPADLAEFSRRFPHQADQLRRLVEEARQIVGDSEVAESAVEVPGADAWGPGQAQAAAPLPELPEQFGRYRILKKLGEGGMGAVYLAEDTQLDRQVALKIPRFLPEDDPEALQRFYREARAAGTIRHPNLCPVYDVGQIEGVHYLTMAYVRGRPLSETFAPGEPADQREVAALVRTLAMALEEAHQKGVIHRDLKPTNVMVDQQGEPVIVDFGLARRTGTQDIRLTQSGIFLGTPAYMAPEQVRGDVEAMGPASDIYSLGVILYELVCGRLPFVGSAAAVLGQIQYADPPPPSQLRLDLDPALEAVCLKAMAKRVDDRYRSMAELAAALSDYLASPGGKPPPAAGPRRWLWMALLGTGAGMLFLGLVIFIKVKLTVGTTTEGDEPMQRLTRLRVEPLEDRRLLSAGLPQPGELLLTLRNPSPDPGDEFGRSVGVVGDGKIIVGATYDDTYGSDAGIAYLFDGRTGELLHTFPDPKNATHATLHSGDAFGEYVAGVGSDILIGAPLDDSRARDAGAAYLFDGTTGDLLRTFYSPEPAAGDAFGRALAALGDDVLIGAAKDDHPSAADAGSVYLFDGETGQLVQRFPDSTNLTHPAPIIGARFGHAIATIADEGILIGAPDPYGPSPGTVYSFRHNESTGAWDLDRITENPEPEPGERFGHTIAAANHRILSGTHYDGTYGYKAGIAYLFDTSTEDWAWLRIPDPENPTHPTPLQYDEFGKYAAAVGDNLLIGSPQPRGPGVAYLFDGATADLLLTIPNPEPATGDEFGTSVRALGNDIVVAAYHDDAGATNAGSVYVFAGANRRPEVADDSYSVDEDNVLSVPTLGVLDNDHDADGDTLTPIRETDPVHGTLQLGDDGSFTYTPAPDFHGTDTFTYRAFDGVDYSESAATVTITVNSVVDALVDIKPGSDPNSINLDSNGVLAVAILSTQTEKGEPDDFDATSLSALDLAMFEFGDSREGYGRVNAIRSSLEDVDGDGDLDLVLHFSMEDIREAGALAADTVDAVLTAEFGGDAIGVDLSGFDAINIVPPSKDKSEKGK